MHQVWLFILSIPDVYWFNAFVKKNKYNVDNSTVLCVRFSRRKILIIHVCQLLQRSSTKLYFTIKP